MEEFEEVAPEIIEEAKLMGWVELEAFKGNPEKWTPADEYVERGKTILPIVKAQGEKWKQELIKSNEELKATKAEIQDLKKTMEKVIKTHQKISESEYNRAMETLKKQQLEAVNNADSEEFERLETERGKIQKPEVIETAPETPAKPGFVSEWENDNKWFIEKPHLGMYAEAIESFVAKQNKGKSGREILDLVTEEVKKRFPEDFQNANKSKPSAVDGGEVQSAGESGNGKKTYRDLPKDAKDACDMFIKQIPGMTREKYVAEYFAD